jgi:hypothetical protein
VQVYLTANDIVQVIHAHTIHVAVAGVIALVRLKLSTPKD